MIHEDPTKGQQVPNKVVHYIDHFNSWEFSLFNPIHEFSRTTVFIRNFLDFCVEKSLFGLFDYSFESLPVFQMS